MPSTQEVVAEAIRSAFYSYEFVELLGEGRHDKWPESSNNTFHRFGERGRQCVLVTVSEMYRGDKKGCVVVTYEWLNLSGESVIRGTETGVINCNIPSEEARSLDPAATNAVQRALLIYRDVLEGTGVAGPIQDLAPESNNDETDEDDESEAPDENEVWS